MGKPWFGGFLLIFKRANETVRLGTNARLHYLENCDEQRSSESEQRRTQVIPFQRVDVPSIRFPNKYDLLDPSNCEFCPSQTAAALNMRRTTQDGSYSFTIVDEKFCYARLLRDYPGALLFPPSSCSTAHFSVSDLGPKKAKGHGASCTENHVVSTAEVPPRRRSGSTQHTPKHRSLL
jgi:hypothetical protein